MFWVKEGLYDATDLYEGFSTDGALRTVVRQEGGLPGRAPPRFNCTACPPGRFSNRSGVYYDGCLPCANGTYSNDPVGAAFCTPCARGKFQIALGAPACDECPAGTYMNFTGEGTGCEPCQRGRSTNGATGMLACSECSELNTPLPEGKKSVTDCEPKMSCGKKGGDYYFQSKKGEEFCDLCR